MKREKQKISEQVKELTELDCLDAIAGLANQLGIERWTDTVQGKEQEAMSIARDLRSDLKRLLGLEPPPQQERPVELTERELEVLRWAAKGKSASVTAQIMQVSEKSVRKARETAAKKLGSHNLTQSVVAATRRGIL